MAKVMISIPDEVLRRIDTHVETLGDTRSGFLRRVAEREIAAGEAERRERIEDLLAKATTSLGGNSAQLIREDRESH